ncbi:MAG: hypothetical protein GXX08_08895 [Firmicutes bacterium]|nr:hypothetical protein [Bacillota bacterium]
MISCTLGNGMCLAMEDFELALPAMELPFGHLSPVCKGRVIAFSGPRLSDGALLCWSLEPETIVVALEGSKAIAVHVGQRDVRVSAAAETTAEHQEE